VFKQEEDVLKAVVSDQHLLALQHLLEDLCEAHPLQLDLLQFGFDLPDLLAEGLAVFEHDQREVFAVFGLEVVLLYVEQGRVPLVDLALVAEVLLHLQRDRLDVGVHLHLRPLVDRTHFGDLLDDGVQEVVVKLFLVFGEFFHGLVHFSEAYLQDVFVAFLDVFVLVLGGIADSGLDELVPVGVGGRVQKLDCGRVEGD